MTKSSGKWPLRVWCVCYKSVDYPGGWVPYARCAFYFRPEAAAEARERPQSKVKAFYIGPRDAFRDSEGKL